MLGGVLIRRGGAYLIILDKKGAVIRRGALI